MRPADAKQRSGKCEAPSLVATSEGNPEAAIELLTTSLVRATDSSDRRGVAMAVEGLADAHAALGELSFAARLLGAAEILRDEIGGAPPVSQRGCVDRADRIAREGLDRAAYQAERALGVSEAHSVVADFLLRESV